MQRTLFAIALLLVGCDSAGKDDATGTTTTGETTTTTTGTLLCEAMVGAVDPGDISEAAINTVISVDFTEAIGPLAAFDVALTSGAGSVSGVTEIAEDGLSGTFTPDADLAFDTTYDLTTSVCDDILMTSFRTPAAVVNPTDLNGRSYALDLGLVNWVEPANSTLLASLLTVDYILVQIREANVASDTLSAVAGTGAASGVDIIADCGAADDTPPADFSANPDFQIGPTPFAIQVGADMVDIEDFLLAGRFSDDLSTIDDVLFSGLIDPAGFGFDNCGVVALLFQGTCVPCPSGLGQCLVIEGRANEALYRSDVDLIAECNL